MSACRAVYIFLFPLLFSLGGLGLSLVSFLSGYERAPGLRGVHFMTVDLSKVNVTLGNESGGDILRSAEIPTVYTIGTNGWCDGYSAKKIQHCKTPYEPFYVSLDLLLKEAGLSDIENDIPKKVKTYNDMAKTVTLALWGTLLATVILSFLTSLTCFFSICSYGLGCLAVLFGTLAFIAAGLSASIATGVYYIFTSRINKVVEEFGARATLDVSGLGCIWGATVALLLADIFTMFSGCCCTQERPRYANVPEKRYY